MHLLRLELPSQACTPEPSTASQSVAVEPLIDDLLDGGLGEPDRRMVDAHLEVCEDCREAVAHARLLQEALGGLEEVPCPDHVIARLNAELKRVGASPGGSPEERGRSAKVERLRTSTWIRAAVLLGLLGAGFLATTVLQRSGSDHSQSTSSAEDSQASLYTDAELAKAEEDLKFALAYFGGIAQRATTVLRDDVMETRVIGPPRRALQTFGEESTTTRETTNS